MSNVAQKFPDEPPTKPCENVPSQMLIRVARIEAHARRAVARLMVDPTEDDIAGVVGDLGQILSLAHEVLR